MRTGTHFARKRSNPSSPVHASAPRIGFQIPSARKPAQTTIKLTTMTATKLEEARSSRMTTPVPQSGRSLVSLSLDAESLGQIAFARLLINQVDDDVPWPHPCLARDHQTTGSFQGAFVGPGKRLHRDGLPLRSGPRMKHLHGIERPAGARTGLGNSTQ
jgi:hypothetical protein